MALNSTQFASGENNCCLQVKEQHKVVLEKHHRRFHPIWGQLLKTGYQNSRFAHQVERFACLYTSHVSNLTFYSPEKSFRSEHTAWSVFLLWHSLATKWQLVFSHDSY